MNSKRRIRKRGYTNERGSCNGNSLAFAQDQRGGSSKKFLSLQDREKWMRSIVTIRSTHHCKGSWDAKNKKSKGCLSDRRLKNERVPVSQSDFRYFCLQTWSSFWWTLYVRLRGNIYSSWTVLLRFCPLFCVFSPSLSQLYYKVLLRVKRLQTQIQRNSTYFFVWMKKESLEQEGASLERKL